MVNLVLPDSSVFIDLSRAGQDPFASFGAQAYNWEFSTCGMVVLEVTRGIRSPKILKSFRERFGVMINIPTTQAIWDRASHLAWSLDRKGVILPAQDILIAAHALHTGATLLTHDQHFRTIPGLQMIEKLG